MGSHQALSPVLDFVDEPGLLAESESWLPRGPRATGSDGDTGAENLARMSGYFGVVENRMHAVLAHLDETDGTP